MNQLIIRFSKLPENDLLQQARLILNRLTGNSDFPSPTPPLADLAAAIQNYGTALARESTPSNTTLKKSAKAALIDVLQALALHLELTAAGVLTKLAGIGYTLRRKPVRSESKLSAPEQVQVKHSQFSGEVILSCKRRDNVRSFEVQHAFDPVNGPWTPVPPFTASRGMRIPGLERGKDYWFRLRAIGANGPGAWSDVVTIMVV